LSDLRLAEIEAEVLWGDEVRERTNALHACVGDLRWALMDLGEHRHFQKTHPPEQSDHQQREDWIRVNKVVWGSGDSEDQFANEVRKAISELENLLRPRLKL